MFWRDDIENYLLYWAVYRDSHSSRPQQKDVRPFTSTLHVPRLERARLHANAYAQIFRLPAEQSSGTEQGEARYPCVTDDSQFGL